MLGLTPNAAVALLLCAVTLLTACGKKGPPLPPLLKVPVAPANLTAERFGSDVRLQFTVPAENTDRTRPANIERIDVYGLTGEATVSDDELLKQGTKIASVAVKAPRDPNAATEPDESQEEPEFEGDGLDQGSVALIEEQLPAVSAGAVPMTADRARLPLASGPMDAPQPLLGPASSASRVYVVVGINKSGRKGPLSTRVAVPIVAAPPAPSTPVITYDEKSITVSWTPPPSAAPIQAPATGDVLPARAIGPPEPPISYHVYGGTSRAPADAGGGSPPETRLTKTPLTETRYTEDRVDWGRERCYAVRSVRTIGDLTVESEAPPAACKTLVDAFPPAAPSGLTPVASEGAINLIWDPNNETDLAGYIVLRGVSPSDTLDRITPSPIAETTFSDKVQPGVRYVYAVQAVDKAGNVSAMSSRVEEVAR